MIRGAILEMHLLMRVGICTLTKGLSNNYQERGKAEKRASHYATIPRRGSE